MSTAVSRHRVVDDLFVLDSSTGTGTDANGPFKNSLTYKPSAMGDPAFRACAGKTWAIPAVGATHQSLQGTFQIRTDPGTLTIVAIHESVTVAAGTFDTVRYTKTLNTGQGQVRDEFWKSIEHGVTVKRTGTPAGRHLDGNAAGDQVASAASMAASAGGRMSRASAGRGRPPTARGGTP